MNKVKSLIMVVAMLLASMESLPVMAFLNTECVEEIVKQQEGGKSIKEYITYTENKSDYKYIEKKINIESENSILDRQHPDIKDMVYDFEFDGQLFPEEGAGKLCWFIRNKDIQYIKSTELY